MKKHVSTILIILGSIFILIAILGSSYGSNQKKILLDEFYNGDKQDLRSTIRSESLSTSDKDGMSDSAIGVLKIPKIDLEEAIRDGMSKQILRFSLGHEETSAYPGEVGNFVIAGHRNYVFGKFFNRLNELEIGDNVLVETKNKDYTYKITEIKVVKPEEVSVMDKTEYPSITMITCTPIYIGTHRLIVKGELIGATKHSNSS